MPSDRKRPSSSSNGSKVKKQKTEVTSADAKTNGTRNGNVKKSINKAKTKRTYPKDITKESLKVDVSCYIY